MGFPWINISCAPCHISTCTSKYDVEYKILVIIFLVWEFRNANFRFLPLSAQYLKIAYFISYTLHLFGNISYFCISTLLLRLLQCQAVHHYNTYTYITNNCIFKGMLGCWWLRWWVQQVDINYLWTYDLYGPVCNVFDVETWRLLWPNPSNGPSNGFASIKHITYRAVTIRGP